MTERDRAAEHPLATTAEATDWQRIVTLFDLLARVDPSPVVELNRAVALAMRDGPNVGIEGIDRILETGELVDYHPAHVARAELLRRMGRTTDAQAAYRRALQLAHQDPERHLIERKLDEADGIQIA